VSFQEDVRMSETILTRLSEAYRKLRNTFRYMLGNLNGFDPQTDSVPASEMPEIDQWILIKAEELVLRSRVWYNDFEFHKVYRAVYDFATVELSNVYFDVLKDRLYTAATKGQARRSAQTVLYSLAHALVRLLAPILSFTCEEVWTHLCQPGTVHTALFPEPSELTVGLHEHNRKQAGNWDRLMEVREEVLKALETARQEKFIGAPLEARVRIAAAGEVLEFLQSYAQDLPGLFIVSQVVLDAGPDGPLQITVERAAGVKCERCWKYTEDVGLDPQLPAVCGSCSAAIRENLNA
jgi:isoleucyl-tRNA synthetase